jgi:hypothetical protein
MHHFCTYFDGNYLLRGLTLYRSLTDTGCEFTLHVLALDAISHHALASLALPNLKPILLADIEAANPDLAPAKANRGRIEYYFTLTPLLPLYVFANEPTAEVVTYLDADLHFHASPDVLLAELGDRSILSCEHRYPPRLHGKLVYGRFNVQFQAFRRDATGLACLQRWRGQCIDWCYDRIDGDRYADQKYLDEWPRLYGDRLGILQHKGGGVAPWNWSLHPMRIEQGTMFIGDQPLVFYHFHGLKIFGPHLVSNGLLDWGLMPYRQRRWIYGRYVRALRASRCWVLERIGIDLPMKDRTARGQGIGLSTLGEVARKAWAQGMVIP